MLHERLYHGPIKWLLDETGLKPHAEAYYWRVARRIFGPTITLSVAGYTREMQTSSWEEYAQLATVLSERPVIADLLDRLRDTDVFWDIGANIGLYSALAAEAGATVVAIEPVPAHCSSLRVNCPEATIHQCAISNESGTARVPTSTAVNVTWGLQRSAGESRVDVVTPSELAAESPSVVKIDVEGHELSVLEGLAELIEGIRLCYVEVHESNGIDREVVAERLREIGLQGMTLHDREGTVFLLGKQR